MRFPSWLLVLALGAQLAAPALADAPPGGRRPAGPAAHAAPAATAPTAPRAPRAVHVSRRHGGTIAHITVGCASSPRRVPRPVVVIIPTIAVVVISVCITPQDIFRIRRG